MTTRKYHRDVYRKRIAGGFRIVRRSDGYHLLDTDAFNNWGERGPIASRDAAVEYAWDCWQFKTGQRQTLPPIPQARSDDRHLLDGVREG